MTDSYADNANTFVIPAYTRLNATVFYNKPRYRISLKVDNLLDEQYWISDGFYFRPQKPLNVMAGIALKF